MKISQNLSEKVAFHKQRTHRIEALSDGVCAIAMTLLVLDVRAPLIEMNSEQDIWLSLVHLLPKILTFMYTFLVAGLFWAMLANQFNHIHTSDRNETVIAIFYLMFISLLPFSASYLSDHLQSKVAVGFYVLNIFVIAQTLWLHWLYCYHNDLVQAKEDTKTEVHRTIMKRARFATSVYLVVGIFCFFNTNIALGILVCIQLFFVASGFIEMMIKKKSPNH